MTTRQNIEFLLRQLFLNLLPLLLVSLDSAPTAHGI